MSVYTINHTTTLVTLECCTKGCGIVFAVPESLNRKALDDHSVRFYCPNGHHVGYSGKTDREIAVDRANELARRLASREDDVRSARMATEAERRRHAATKGQLTKTKNRADKGVCLHCSRSFANVQRHVAHMHPDVTA